MRATETSLENELRTLRASHTDAMRELWDAMQDEIRDIKTGKVDIEKGRLIVQARRAQVRTAEVMVAVARLQVQAQKRLAEAANGDRPRLRAVNQR